MAYSDLFFLFT
uniref:Uncharacterized protein n=1 Tax=Arundo donax TaxID=35708 RepID=A0A0A9C3X4_ARUDO